MTGPARHTDHTDVGAYALGVLDAADAARFEEHLAACPRCAAELDGLMGLTPLLADYKESMPPHEETVSRPAPRPEMLPALLEHIAVTRRRQRVRRACLAGAASAMIVAGPLAALAVTAEGEPDHSGTSMAQQMYQEGDKYGAVDPGTGVDATVSLMDKPWGTRVVLKLANVKGPLSCDLVAVGKNGRTQTVTTWAVPASGYGIDKGGDKWGQEPLYTHGGTAFNREEIARFEVRTLDGQHLATVNMQNV